MARYEGAGVRLYFRADAALASPEIYDYLEEHGLLYAIRLPSNPVLEKEIEPLLKRPVGRPPQKRVVWYDDFWTRRRAGGVPGGWSRKFNGTRESSFPGRLSRHQSVGQA